MSALIDFSARNLVLISLQTFALFLFYFSLIQQFWLSLFLFNILLPSFFMSCSIWNLVNIKKLYRIYFSQIQLFLSIRSNRFQQAGYTDTDYSFKAFLAFYFILQLWDYSVLAGSSLILSWFELNPVLFPSFGLEPVLFRAYFCPVSGLILSF